MSTSKTSPNAPDSDQLSHVDHPCGEAGPSAGIEGIRERMEVIACCGTKVGVVDHVYGPNLQLTKNDSPDGKHHFVPIEWVGRVHDNHIHLRHDAAATMAGWKSENEVVG